MNQKNLYLENGYLNFSQIVDNEYPFSFVIGGRATGKTFGALRYAAEHYQQTGETFIYMRRTKSQADLISTEFFNPFKPVNTEYGWEIEAFSVAKGVNGFYQCARDPDSGKRSPFGGCMGVIAAFSTFSNFRGFDASTVDLVIYDEFQRNAGERSIRDEGFALLNVFETVNRNRELIGRPPVKLICLSNANSISNDVYIDLQLVGPSEQMRKTGKNQWYLPERGIALYDLSDSQISRKKKDTALYRMDAGGRFTDMSLNNEYEDYDTSMIRSEPLKEFRPLVKIGEICIYQHKSDRRYYASFHEAGTFPHFNMTSVEKERFIRKYVYLWEAFLSDRISFESFLVKKIFEQLFV